LQRNGTLGLVATNTVAQGDTREVGLDAMVADRFTITRAIQSRSWPASSANLEYAAVWGTLGPVAGAVPRLADDVPVSRISTLLESVGRAEGNPTRLAENAGIGFQGCIVLGMGFVLDVAEAQEWIATDPRNAEVLFPYLNGEDLNQRPDCSPSRWVIDFNDRNEAEASKYVLPFARVLEQVKPERMKNNRKVYRDYWWQYAEKRPAMRRAIADLDEVLVIARVSKSVMPMRVPTGQVFHEKAVVFATDSYAIQAVLSSSVHQLWAIKYGTTMRIDPTYTPDLVFGSLPIPEISDPLQAAGRTLDVERRKIMLRRAVGLTKLYNLVNDPEIRDGDIDQLRRIHVELDREVLDSYGWPDIDPSHGFHSYRHMTRWSVNSAARVEILDRLLEENQCRVEREQRSKRAPSRVEIPREGGTLFG
jgi:MmeI, target recognition domain